MNKAKYYRFLSLLCMALSLASYALFQWRGATAENQGVLRESFGLIPTAWMFFAAGVWYGLRYRGARSQNNVAAEQKEKE